MLSIQGRKLRIQHRYFQQVTSYLAAILLTIVVLPHSMEPYRPYFFLISLYYWVLQPVKLLSVFWIWLLGLLLDFATGSLLGQHALVLVVIASALQEIRPRLLLYGFWQHLLLASLFSCFYVLLQAWFMANIANITVNWHYYYGIIGTLFLWLLMYFTTRITFNRSRLV